MNRLVAALQSGRVLLMDGAMGTELQRLGLPPSEPADLWNLTHPEQVRAVHRAYREAGAEVLVTNTFQTNPEGLVRYGLLPQLLPEIRDAAIDHARGARDPSPLVVLDVGPYRPVGPKLLEPRAGIDGVLLETWSPAALAELVAACRDRSTEVPLLVSFAFQHLDSAAPMRALAETAARFCEQTLHVAAVGANCGAEIDLDDLHEIVHGYRAATDLPLFVRPNAGTPQKAATGWLYPRSPEAMAEKLWPLLEAGITMIGGCCGTTPAHLAAFRHVVDQWNARKP